MNISASTAVKRVLLTLHSIIHLSTLMNFTFCYYYFKFIECVLPVTALATCTTSTTSLDTTASNTQGTISALMPMLRIYKYSLKTLSLHV